eukprot:CAMPEP_0117657522 /NCGR_PEP_ID=MMETSP0804-20121206/5377_1 /TAXON_ID=1074897 /ORGANISM="Tetraselmis astigmatica, Strain CCMP880" /LENGTH=677 /DNA_ID=CAMNT_0005463985 /DNA_START=44 /DNA_END=2078 /DNA_ORIENTATION=+
MLLTEDMDTPRGRESDTGGLDIPYPTVSQRAQATDLNKQGTLDAAMQGLLLQEEMSEEAEPGGLQLPESFASREEGIRFCFEYVDKDQSGFLDRSEFRTIATKVNPQENLAEANQKLDEMDLDKDGFVSWEEFLSAFEVMTANMTEEEFMHNIRKNVIMEEHLQDGYKHPVKNRRYLQRTYINAVLSEGLEQLVKEIYLHRATLASGTLWDEKGFLPRGYMPLNPLKFLGNFVMDQVQNDATRREAFAEQERKRLALAQMELYKPYCELTKLGKLKLLWNSLVPEAVEDHSSKLPMKRMVAVGQDLGYPLAVVDEILERCGYSFDDDEQPDDLEFFEFEVIFDRFTEDFVAEEVDAYIMLQLGAGHLPHLNTKEKAQMIFAKLDDDHSGELEIAEIVLLAKMLDPFADEVSIRKTVAYLDKDGSQTVDHEEFVTAMTKILDAARKSDVNNAITKILEIGVDAVDLATQYMDKKLKAYVTGHASHKLADQLGVQTVMERLDDNDPVVFIDVRSPQETAVSTICGAILAPAVAASKSKSGWTLRGSLEGLSEEDWHRLRDGGEQEKPPLVVVYDTVGPRAASVSAELSKKLEGKVVYNLCGGIIEWYNKGGEVVDGDGNPVEAIHPEKRELMEFLQRPSTYQMPAATAKKSAMKKSGGSEQLAAASAGLAVQTSCPSPK